MTSPRRHRLCQSRPRPPAIATTTSTTPTVSVEDTLQQEDHIIMILLIYSCTARQQNWVSAKDPPIRKTTRSHSERARPWQPQRRHVAWKYCAHARDFRGMHGGSRQVASPTHNYSAHAHAYYTPRWTGNAWVFRGYSCQQHWLLTHYLLMASVNSTTSIYLRGLEWIAGYRRYT